MNTLVDARHRGHVVPGFADRGGDILGDRAKARAAIGDRQIVIDGLGNMHGLDRVAKRGGNLRNLQAGIGRIAATVVEEIADIVCLEYFNQALVLFAMRFQ